VTELQLIVLAVIQGITEFLPISSSGHLVLVPHVFGWPDQGLSMDVAVHVGTLFAVMGYFYRDSKKLFVGFGQCCTGRIHTPSARLFLLVALATLPVLAIGLIVKKVFGDSLRSMDVIAYSSIVFGVLLWWADRYGRVRLSMAQMGWRHALYMGMAQCLALIPGASRSGVTMMAARGLGYNREESAQFSMIMAIPTIMAAGALIGLDVYENGGIDAWQPLLMGAAVSCLTAVLAIHGLMVWLKKCSFTPFVVYRVVLGIFLLGLSYTS
jgi:undecaprenyl-diphosphatase